MTLLDIILDYECNLACDYCTCVGRAGAALATEAAVAAMRHGRVAGLDAVSFTGGEPTLRRDLIPLIRTARALGYCDVKLQTNGLVLAHRPNLDRILAAGTTLVHLSVQTHLPDAYDRMVRRAGAHALMAQALDHLVASGVQLRCDLIITATTRHHLESAVRWLAARGVSAIDVWYVSLSDANRGNHSSLPSWSDAVPRLREALAAARALGIQVRSLHVPRCVLGADHPHAWDPGSSRVRVVSPEATFDLSDSRLAGQVHVAACEGCNYFDVCPGIRPDYLARFGDSEIVAARAGEPASRSPVQGSSGISGSS